MWVHSSYALVSVSVLALADVSESDFLSYEGRFGDNLSGKLDAKSGYISVNVEGRGSSKLQSSFGKLKKQDVDVQKLLLASNDRYSTAHRHTHR